MFDGFPIITTGLGREHESRKKIVVVISIKLGLIENPIEDIGIDNFIIMLEESRKWPF
jgi:hypothetical protein